MVKEEFYLPWEAKALDGLELPNQWAWIYPLLKIQILKFTFA